jgi:hypothetical protein
MNVGALENREDNFKLAVSTSLIYVTKCGRILTIAQVLKRDAYRCVATGMPDVHHPALAPEEEAGALKTIIFRQAIAVFGGCENNWS